MANVSSSNGLEKYPKLRFPGFDEPWKSIPFGSLYHYTSEKNNGEYDVDRIISVANMYFKPDARISDADYLKTYNIFRLGDIAFEGNKSKSYSYGRFVENTIGDGIVSHVFVVFRPISTDHNLDYWKYAINNENIMGRILSKCTKKTTMMTNLVTDDFLGQVALVPCTAEQKKIADFLNLIDERITKQQCYVESLKKYKRGLLSFVFSDNKDNKHCRVYEVCDVLSGKRIPKGFTFSSNQTQHRYITVSDMGDKYVKTDNLQYIDEETERQIRKYKVAQGDIIISVAGTLGKLNIITADIDGVNLTENCDRFTNFKGIQPEYLYYVLSSDLIQDQIEASKTQNGQPKLALERIRNFVIPLPDEHMQAQIVKVLSKVDHRIHLEILTFFELLNARSSIMQQLFI